MVNMSKVPYVVDVEFGIGKLGNYLIHPWGYETQLFLNVSFQWSDEYFWGASECKITIVLLRHVSQDMESLPYQGLRMLKVTRADLKGMVYIACNRVERLSMPGHAIPVAELLVT